MITGCPRSAERLTWLPSASGRVKSGAGSPGARRSSVTRAPFGQYGRTHGTGRGRERAVGRGGTAHVSPGTPECRLACRTTHYRGSVTAATALASLAPTVRKGLAPLLRML